MIVMGLTGSVGMGKSTAARVLRSLGCPVNDADAAVHRLMGPGGAAVPLVDEAFPGVVRDGRVDRAALGASVFGDPKALKRLEAILHPLVARERDRFLWHCAVRQVSVAVLDIPLLFETGGERHCDLVVVVSAPDFVQEARVLARPGMTRAKFGDIRAKQMPDREKRRRADIVVETGLGRYHALRQLREAVRIAGELVPRQWPPGPRATWPGPVRPALR